MEEFEENYQNLKTENRELHRTVKVQQEEIENLKEEMSFKDGIIGEKKQWVVFAVKSGIEFQNIRSMFYTKFGI